MSRTKCFAPKAGSAMDGNARAQYRWHGVNVESSASDAGELDTMLDLVSALSPADRALVGTMYCDSDAGHCSVHLRRGNHGVVSKLVRTCASVLYARFGSVRSLTIVPAGSFRADGSRSRPALL